MAQLKDILAVEYSLIHYCFHVERLIDMISDNYELTINDRKHPPYCLIALAPDNESANAIIEDYRERLTQDRRRKYKRNTIFDNGTF